MPHTSLQLGPEVRWCGHCSTAGGSCPGSRTAPAEGQGEWSPSTAITCKSNINFSSPIKPVSGEHWPHWNLRRGGAVATVTGLYFAKVLAAPAHTLTRGPAWGSTALCCRALGWKQSLVPKMQALGWGSSHNTPPGTGTGRNPAGLGSTSPPWSNRRHLPLARHRSITCEIYPS